MFETAASHWLAGLRARPRRWRSACSRLMVINLVLLAGCHENGSPTASSSPTDAAATRASVALKVLVVNDPALAEAINRLRGEWAERSGGALIAEAKPWSDVADSDTIDADVVIFPVRYLGALVETNRLRPMRASAFDNDLYDSDDLLSLVRRKLSKYGQRTFAVPLSVEVPLVAYRPTALEETGGLPTDSRIAFLDRASRGEAIVWPASGTIEHGLAIMLLARAAGYAHHPQQELALFDPQSMNPRIAEPPFVRALEEFRTEKSLPDTNGLAQPGQLLRWAELPGPNEVYDRSSGSWEPVDRVALPTSVLAGGELLAVTSSSRNAASAFNLAVWLASAEISRQLAPIGRGTLPVRRSQLATIDRWVNSVAGRTEDAQFARVVQTALDRGEALVVLRIPGADAYLTALSEAVDEVLRDEATSANALKEAAVKWDAITDRLGRDAQRRAYLRDLGLDEP